ncbi:hypothetical protein EYF80_013291 [Liparis tanakae]|uniref:Uncharacterized protein n=1 Tax=Liparis tanakae TaxID=230148 RepID=A0A4Z2IER4_9TELE|nr:hypothetical protein EYF80_013291 [Liparis tanakae]
MRKLPLSHHIGPWGISTAIHWPSRSGRKWAGRERGGHGPQTSLKPQPLFQWGGSLSSPGLRRSSWTNANRSVPRAVERRDEAERAESDRPTANLAVTELQDFENNFNITSTWNERSCCLLIFPPSQSSLVEEVVMDNVQDLPKAMCLLFGLSYSLHLNYPKSSERELIRVRAARLRSYVGARIAVSVVLTRFLGPVAWFLSKGSSDGAEDVAVQHGHHQQRREGAEKEVEVHQV